MLDWIYFLYIYINIEHFCQLLLYNVPLGSHICEGPVVSSEERWTFFGICVACVASSI